ncbi:MAG: glycosyltransferase family 4 protein [Propionivibrio sp.]|nr:glycosyltransferase family 4 protein [Propionivibrio sp.]
MTEIVQVPQGKLLLYLPWKFDRLGGVDVVVDRLWNGLEKRFPGMSTIGIQDWEFQGDLSDDQGRRFLHLNLPAPPSAEGSLSIRYRVTLARRLPALLYELMKRNFATVNVHYPTLNAYPLALLKCLGLWRGKLVLSFHGSDVGEIFPDSPRWRTIAAQTDAMTACSAALARQIDEMDLFHQPVQVVHNGIDIEAFQAEGNKSLWEQLPPNSYLLNVGNFVSRKAHDDIIKAFSQVASEFPEINLILAGGKDNGVWLDNLQRLVVSLGLLDRISFITDVPHDQVASLVSGARAFVHAAHAEPFGLVLIEAGVLGVPIVATEVGGIPEVVGSEGALLYPAGDISALAGCLRRTLRGDAECTIRVARMSARVNAMFSVQKMTERYLESYQ